MARTRRYHSWTGARRTSVPPAPSASATSNPTTNCDSCRAVTSSTAPVLTSGSTCRCSTRAARSASARWCEGRRMGRLPRRRLPLLSRMATQDRRGNQRLRRHLQLCRHLQQSRQCRQSRQLQLRLRQLQLMQLLARSCTLSSSSLPVSRRRLVRLLDRRARQRLARHPPIRMLLSQKQRVVHTSLALTSLAVSSLALMLFRRRCWGSRRLHLVNEIRTLGTKWCSLSLRRQ